MTGPDDKIPLFDGLTLDLARGSLLRAGVPVHLRPLSYGVLRYLAERRGRLVTKDELLDAVWEGRAVTDGALGKCVEEVREALGATGPQYLRNVRGRGYILEAAETEPAGEPAEDRTSRAAQSVSASTPGPEAGPNAIVRSRPRRRPALVWISAVLVAAAAVLLYLRLAGNSSRAITSIAVLPFVNANQDPELEYLCDGLSEGLTNSLSRQAPLRVVASYSAFQYKGQESNLDLQQVGRALGAEAVVTGRVARRGDELSISVAVVDVRDRSQVWGQLYTRKAADLQSAQREMEHTILEALRVERDRPQQQGSRLAAGPQAYSFYLSGLYHRRRGGVEEVKIALDYFQRALVLSPPLSRRRGSRLPTASATSRATVWPIRASPFSGPRPRSRKHWSSTSRWPRPTWARLSWRATPGGSPRRSANTVARWSSTRTWRKPMRRTPTSCRRWRATTRRWPRSGSRRRSIRCGSDGDERKSSGWWRRGATTRRSLSSGLCRRAPGTSTSLRPACALR